MSTGCVSKSFRSTCAALPLLLLLCGEAAPAQSVTFVPNAVRFAGVGTSSSGFNTDFGVATATRLSGPTGLAFDGNGNLIVADKNNNCVRRIDATSAHITTTIAGLAATARDTCNTSSNAAPTATQGLLSPSAVAADAVGNVYIADTGHNCVRELPTGSTGVANLATVAGTCGATNANSATPVPTSLAFDPAGALYILVRDTAFGTYQVLRRPATGGALCRVAGAASSQGVAQCSDVSGAVTLNGAAGIGFDGGGALYIADTNSNCVRKLSGGTFSTALGTCGSAASAVLKPTNVAFSLSGSMYVTLKDNNQLVRYNQNDATLLLVAGNADTTPGAYAATQDGAASSTLPLNGPTGLVKDANNNLYLADSGNNIIRELRNGTLFGSANVGASSSQQVLTFQINTATALTVTPGQDYSIVSGSDTCTGPQTPAASGSTPAFCSVGLVFSPTAPGNRYAPLTITDSASAKVNVGLQGTGVGSLAELLPGQAGTFASSLGTVIDLTSDSVGRVYALVRPAGGQPQVLRYPAGGGAPTVFLAAGAGMNTPTAIALDAAGNLYVADTTGSSTSAPSIQRYGADGSVNGNYITGIVAPAALVVDGFGNMLIAEQGTANDVLRVYLAGGRGVVAGGGTAIPTDGTIATAVKLGKPAGVALYGGTVYFSDSAAHVVYSVDALGKIHPVAGSGASTVSTATTVVAALSQPIGSPAGLDVDAAGDLYIADTTGSLVYLYFPDSDPSANLLPIFGTGTGGNTGDGDVSTKATITSPTAVSVTEDGMVHIAAGNAAIRSISFPAETVDFGSVAIGSTTTGFQPLVNSGNANLVRIADPAVSNADFTYDGADTTCSSVVTYGQLCNFAFTFAPGSTGSKSATVTVSDNAPNSPQTFNLAGTVIPALITSFTATPETESYGGPYTGTVAITTNGGTIPNGTVTFTINGSTTCSVTGAFSGSASCTLPNGTLLPVRPTPYPVAVTFTGNYPNQSTNTTLTEMARLLTETVNSQTKVYLQSNPILDGAPNGLVRGVGSDSFTVVYGFGATPITTTTVPGTYANDITATVTPNGSTVASNYNVVVVPGTFSITKGGITGFGADRETEVYGGAYTATASYAPVAGAVAPTGLVTFRSGATTLCTTAISTTATCSGAAGTKLPAGPHTITVSYAGDANYNAATTTATLVVTPAPLAVTVADQTKAFGAAVPNLTGTATVKGLVNGDAVGSTIILTYSTTVTASTPIGTYPNAITVTVSGSSAGNYTLTNTPGSFSVGGVSTATSVTASAASAAAGVPVTFTAKVTSASSIPAGTVVFTSDSTALGTVAVDANGMATITTGGLSAGAHTIRASYSGNANFASSSSTLTETITVPVGGFTLTAASDPQYIRGPGSKTFTVNVASVGGFAGTVSLACSGLPTDATCALGSNSITLTAGASQSVVITTTTTGADATVAANAQPMHRGNGLGALGITAAAVFPLQLSGLGLLLAGGRRRRTLRSGHILLLVLFSFGLLGMAGCGATPAYHIYPVTVTGASIGGGPAASSATVYLAVGTP